MQRKDGLDSSFNEMFIGDSFCTKPEGKETDIMDWDTNLSKKNVNFITCEAPGGNVGTKSAKIQIEGNYGSSQTMRMAEKVDDAGKEFVFKLIPAITSVSHHRGSTEGGLLLKIEGTGLTHHRDQIEITVDGVPCKVVKEKSGKTSNEYVNCVTGKRDFILTPPKVNPHNVSQTLSH
jgi:hypothetical protein